MKLLDGKVIVVSGGSGLLGKSISHACYECGAKVYNCDKVKMEELNQINFIPTDINSYREILSAIEKIDTKEGKIDALVNCAYPRNENYGRDFLEVNYSDFCENVNLHLGGYFLMCQKFVSYYLKQGFGNIVNVSSIYGVVAPEFDIYKGTEMTMPVEYAAIKSSLIHLSKYIAVYTAGKNIRVNCVSPGGIIAGQPSPFIEKYGKKCLNKGMLEPGDIIGSFIFLLSDLSKHINGQNIIVDDGFVL